MQNYKNQEGFVADGAMISWCNYRGVMVMMTVMVMMVMG